MAECVTPVRTNKRSQLNMDTPIVTIPPSPFMKKLGYGTGVAVYELERSSQIGKCNSPWAIKKPIRTKIFDSQYSARLTKEAKILRELKHPNIIGFRAYVKTTDNKPCLAMEECGNCLGDMIAKRQTEGLSAFPAQNIMKVAWDISEALNYLHTQALLLHGDIKSFNILIDGDFSICKLCDFGVSLPLTKEGKLDVNKAGENAEYIGTRLWCAPEVYTDSQVVTSKADIYSYGLVLWEMLALIPPRSDIIDEDCSIDNLEESMDSVDNETEFNKRPSLPNVDFDNTYIYVFEIFHCCTEQNHEDRPTAQDLTISIPEMVKVLGFTNI